MDRGVCWKDEEGRGGGVDSVTAVSACRQMTSSDLFLRTAFYKGLILSKLKLLELIVE